MGVVEQFDGIVGPDAPPGKKWGFIIGCALLLLLLLVVLPIVLTLPETYSCYPEDNAYFVKIIPNASITTVEPPMVCLAQIPQQVVIRGRYMYIRDNTTEGERAVETPHFWWLSETTTASQGVIDSVSGIGDYSLSGTSMANLVAPYKDFRFNKTGSNVTSWRPTFLPGYPGAVELETTWSDCTDDLITTVLPTLLQTGDGYELTFKENTTLRKQHMQQCSEFTVTLPVHPVTETVAPELFLVQPNAPQPHPVALPSYQRPDRKQCQHSTFGELVLFPRPRITRLDPPFVCHGSLVTVSLQGDYMVRHRRGSSDALAHPIIRTETSSLTLSTSATSYATCTDVTVEQFALVEECEAVDLTFNASDVGAAGSHNAWHITNPEPVACESDAAVDRRDFYVAPRPTLPAAGLQWPLWCSGVSLMTTVTGTDFLQADGVQPTVFFDGVALPVSGNVFPSASCTVETSDPEHNLTQCTAAQLTFTPQLTAAQGLAETVLLELELPFQSRTVPPCRPAVSVGLVEPMTHTQTIPLGRICGDSPARDALLVGEFWTIDGAPPVVTVDGVSTASALAEMCNASSVINGLTLQRCTNLRVQSPVLDFKGQHAYVFSHPLLSCDAISTITTDPTLPEMVFTSVVPWAEQRCEAAPVSSVLITGEFYQLDGLPVAVVADNVTLTGELRSCAPAFVQNFVSVVMCTELFASVGTSTLDLIGAHNYTVTASPLCVHSANLVSGSGVPAAQITRAQPIGAVCDSGAAATLTTVALSGHFPLFDDVLPTITVDGTPASAIVRADCDPLTSVSNVSVAICRQLTVSVPSSINLVGVHAWQFTSPNAMCSGFNGALATDDPLPAMQLYDVQPREDCVFFPFLRAASLNGSFWVFNGVAPIVTVDGSAPIPAFLESCGPVLALGVSLTFQKCDRLFVNDSTVVDLTSPPMHLWSFESSPQCRLNNAPAITGPKRIPNVTQTPAPNFMCFDVTSELTFVGVNLAPDGIAPTVELVDSQTGATFEGEVVTFSDTSVTVRYIDGTLIPPPPQYGMPSASTYRIKITNSLQCEFITPVGDASREIVVSYVLTVYADPPYTSDLAQTQLTVFTSGLLFPPVRLSLIQNSSGFRQELTITRVFTNNKFQGLVPTGLPGGLYDLEVTGTYCTSYLLGGLRVLNSTVFSLVGATPSFVWQQRDTRVEFTVSPAQLVALPSVYLTPSSGGPGAVASPVLGLQFIGADKLTAVVPARTNMLPVGAYDVLIINPPGTPGLEVGFFPGAITVIAEEPPMIDSVAPAFFPANGPTRATILGRNLNTSDSIQRSCRQYSSAAATFPDGPATLITDSVNVALSATDGNSLVVDFPIGTLTNDDWFCVITYTRASDGATSIFSGIPLHNPSGNVAQFRDTGKSLNHARFGHVLALSGTSVQRQLYVIGGRNSTSVLNTVEYAEADSRGVIDNWFVLPERTPFQRQFACGFAVRRFIYMIGGENEIGSPTADVWRAQILDPIDVPIVTDLDLSVNVSLPPSFAASTYYYRVSALFGPGFARNPSGETLPSEFAVLNLPAVPGLKVRLTWQSVTGAVSYNVYRTQNAGDAPSQVVLMGNTVDTFFEDDNSAVFTPSAVPLGIGRLGTWHKVGDYPTVITRHACAAVPVGETSPLFYLVGAGGSVDGTSTVSTIHTARLTFNPAVVGDSENQVVDAWATQMGALAAPRGNLAMTFSDPASNSGLPPGRLIVHIGAGSTTIAPAFASGTINRNIEYCDISTGSISSCAVSSPQSNSVYGYCSITGGGYYAQIGGSTGNPGDQTQGSKFTGPLGNLENSFTGTTAGNNLYRSRFHSCGTSTGFVYIVGGLDATDTPRAEVQVVFI